MIIRTSLNIKYNFFLLKQIKEMQIANYSIDITN